MPPVTTTTQPRARVYELVDTWPAADAACARLRTCRIVALDMEGAPLGDGPTSLLQLAVSPCEVFLFDVLALGQMLFDAEHLLPLLSDPKILKLCYDARGDAFALYACHGVRGAGLYDLQIVFTSLFQDTVHDPFLKGLQRVVECIVPPDDARAFTMRKTAIKQHWKQHGCASVLHRPHSRETLEYAADDVIYLFLMYAQWAPLVSDDDVTFATQRRIQRHYRRRRRLVLSARLDFTPLATPTRPPQQRVEVI
jgi:ribonuclease D